MSYKLRGFSILEVMIILAIFAVLFSYVFGVGVEFYQSQLLISERDTVLSLLRSARARAMNNIDQSSHGLYIDSNQYVVYEGLSYALRSQTYDEAFPHSLGIAISGPSDVNFSSSDGSSNVSGTVALSTGAGKSNISVNYEGRIDWQ